MKKVVDSPKIIARLKDYDPSMNGSKIMPKKGVIERAMESLADELKSNSDNDAKTSKILSTADQIVDALGVSEYSVCQKGCAYCCKVPVRVTAMEAIHIGKAIGVDPVEPKFLKETPSDSGYCTFLDHDSASCSIYSLRPLHCRTFHTLDHYKYCEQVDVVHGVIRTHSNEQLHSLENVLISASKNIGADIRSWFPNGMGKKN